MCTYAHVEDRPDLGELREVHGDLGFICKEIHGLHNPRIVIESKDRQHYQVLYPLEDKGALQVIAKALNLEITEEEREIQAITIRESSGGHRLKPAADGQQVKVENVCCDGRGGWPLYGITMDQLARFLEREYWKPVLNMTSLQGRWSILLSTQGMGIGPRGEEKTELADLGLQLQWEKVRLAVTVVKDKPGTDGKPLTTMSYSSN
jgi:hypothetical protein